jgi:hypothetical protein
MNKKNFSIPVLMYHHVNPEGDFINVKPQIFENRMRYLNEHGFTILHLTLRKKTVYPFKGLVKQSLSEDF